MTQGVIKEFGEDALARLAPLNRLGDDEDLKGAALLFASDAGKHITGQILAVDGGATVVLRPTVCRPIAESFWRAAQRPPRRLQTSVSRKCRCRRCSRGSFWFAITGCRSTRTCAAE